MGEVESSVQFSHSVISDSLRLHGLQHTRPPCSSPTPGAYSDSCPTLCNPMDCSPPGSSVHGIFQEEYWSGLPFPTPRKNGYRYDIVILFPRKQKKSPCCCSVAKLCLTLQPHGLQHTQAPLSSTISQFAQIHVH